MAKIFLSHSHRDRLLVDVLVSEISKVLGYSDEERDANIFNSSSPYAIRTGEDWLDKVYKALKSAEVIIPLLTPSSEKSIWVMFEYGYFKRRIDELEELGEKMNKGEKEPILPLVHTINPASPLNVPQAKQVTDENALQVFFEDLCKALDCNKIEEPDVDAIIEAAKRTPKLTAEDRQHQLECTLLLRTAQDREAKNFIIEWMSDQDILREAQFKWMNLQGVDFAGANMQGINLGGSSLQGANFFSANLEDAILGSTKLDWARFDNVISVKNASFEEVNLYTRHIIIDDEKYDVNKALAKLEKRGAKLYG